MSPRRLTVGAIGTALVGLLAAAALVGCGVPLDNAPHPIAQTTIVVADTTPTTVDGAGSQAVTVYFLNGDTLEGQEYQVDGDPTLSEALSFVLAPPPAGGPAGLGTQVPPGTEVRNAEITDGTATIDLTNEINGVSGANQKQAFAQIVFTALAFDGVKRVQFKIDGSPVDAPTDNGNVAVVSASDYDKPLNPR